MKCRLPYTAQHVKNSYILHKKKKIKTPDVYSGAFLYLHLFMLDAVCGRGQPGPTEVALRRELS
jgi:hypothetical protein